MGPRTRIGQTNEMRSLSGSCLLIVSSVGVVSQDCSGAVDSLLNCATTVKTRLGSHRFHCPGALKVTTCMTQLVEAARFAEGLNLPFFDVT